MRDRAATPRLLVPTLIVWALVAGFLLISDHGAVSKGFGDTDDALRMAMVRDLLHGQGWWDLKVARLQPPLGVVMHWSRLLDGVLAAFDAGLSSLLGAVRGELAMRTLWPLLLIGPAVAAVLAVTRRFAAQTAEAGPAVLAAAAACVAGLPLYAQFHPGRIDHHNVQILLWLIAWAGAAGRRPRLGGAVAGAAMGVGLAIGLEALVFHAALAGFLALRFVADARNRDRLRAFAAALLGTTLAAFLVQTPPARWGLPACDALAINLTAGVVVGAAGLALASFAAGRLSTRLAAVAAAGAAAAFAYLALDPHCLHGPFADVDPAIRPIWLADVQEMAPIGQLLRHQFPTGLTVLAALIMAPLAWGVLALDIRRRRSAGFWLGGLMLLVALPSAAGMLRMSSYLFWAATPPLATLAARLALALSRNGAVDRARTAVLALLLCPPVDAALILTGVQLASPAAAAVANRHDAAAPPDRCFDEASYAALAVLPPGRVLAEPDLGPFLLAYTPHAAIAAPYHRMGYGLLAGDAAFKARVQDGPAGASDRIARLGVRYVVTCPAHFGRHPAPRSSLKAALEARRPPPWLTSISPRDAALQIYRLGEPPASPPHAD